MQIVAEFVTSVVSDGEFPRDRLPEVAMVGRSNVGKSSLINALVGRSLARTSAEPGKTRLINVYRVKRGAMPPYYLVDLPGYGYARGVRPPGGARGRRAEGAGGSAALSFQAVTDVYFGRPGRRGVLLLVDSRHPGLASDLEAWTWLQSQPCTRAVVGTKVDKLTRTERARHARELVTLFDGPVVLVSSRTGEGLDELWKMIANLPKGTA